MQDLTKGVMSAAVLAELMLMTAINYQMDRPPSLLNTRIIGWGIRFKF